MSFSDKVGEIMKHIPPGLSIQANVEGGAGAVRDALSEKHPRAALSSKLEMVHPASPVGPATMSGCTSASATLDARRTGSGARETSEASRGADRDGERAGEPQIASTCDGVSVLSALGTSACTRMSMGPDARSTSGH
jgi:hypothetical protein